MYLLFAPGGAGHEDARAGAAAPRHQDRQATVRGHLQDPPAVPGREEARAL